MACAHLDGDNIAATKLGVALGLKAPLTLWPTMPLWFHFLTRRICKRREEGTGLCSLSYQLLPSEKGVSVISVGVTSTCQPSWPSFFCQFLSVLPLLHLTLPEWQAISNRQIVLLIMVHPLGILTHCIFPRGWGRKQQEHDHTMLVCTSLPLAYLSLSISLLLTGAVPRVKILNYFFLAVAKVTFSGMWRTLGHWQYLEDKKQEDLVGDVRPAD